MLCIGFGAYVEKRIYMNKYKYKYKNHNAPLTTILDYHFYHSGCINFTEQ